MILQKVMRPVGCCLAILCSVLAASAQTFTGTVAGRVLDPRRAVIGNADLTLRSVERGSERHTKTNPRGEYIFQLVPPGKFTVRAEAGGLLPPQSTSKLWWRRRCGLT
jgi:hypothetical protein